MNGRGLLKIEWEAIAGIIAATLALVLHFLHLVSIEILVAISVVLLALLFIRNLRREHVTDQMQADLHAVGAGVAECCPVTMIVFPAYDARRTRVARLEAMPPGQAVLRLLENCISLGVNVDRGIEIVIALTEKAESYSLAYHDATDARDRIIERVHAQNSGGVP